MNASSKIILDNRSTYISRNYKTKYEDGNFKYLLN